MFVIGNQADVHAKPFLETANRNPADFNIMSRHNITPPSISTSSTQEVLETLAEAYGNPLQDAARSDISYDIEAWATELRSIYPISTYEPVIRVLEDNPTPANLDAESVNSIKEHFEGCFLRMAVGDMLATAYIEDRLTNVPERLFTALYESPDAPGQNAAAALVLGGFGGLHPDVDYFDGVLKSDALDDFAALFCHLQFSWVIAPDQFLDVYEDILSNGHPLLDAKDNPPGLSQTNDWDTHLAESVIGPILSDYGTPFGFAEHELIRADEILTTADYPHGESKFQELADITTEHTSISEMHEDTRTSIVEYTTQ